MEAERRRAVDLVRFVEEQEPQLLAFNEYVNADGTETTVVQVHPDAALMTKHMAVVAERAAAAYAETLDGTLHIQIYGPMDRGRWRRCAPRRVAEPSSPSPPSTLAGSRGSVRPRRDGHP